MATSLGIGGQIVTDGLVLCLDAANKDSYPGSGTTWYDLSGNGNHATLVNGPTYLSSYFSLDGINDYIYIPSIDFTSTDKLTLQILFKPTTYPATGTVKFIAELTTNFNSFTDGFVTTYDDNSTGESAQCFVSVRGNSGYSLDVWDKSLLTDLEWNFWTPLLDKSISGGSKEVSLYQNGKFITSENKTTYSNDNTNNFGNRPLYFGCRGGSAYFTDLSISSVLVYSRILSTSEILNNYNATKSRFGL